MIKVKTGEEIDLSASSIRRENHLEVVAYLESDTKPVEAWLYRQPDGFYYEIFTLGVTTETCRTNKNCTQEILIERCREAMTGEKKVYPSHW